MKRPETPLGCRSIVSHESFLPGSGVSLTIHKLSWRQAILSCHLDCCAWIRVMCVARSPDVSGSVSSQGEYHYYRYDNV